MESFGPFRHGLDTYKQNPNPDEWLIPGLIPTDGLVVLASAPKTGKTCLATAIAMAVVKGGEFMGHQIKQGPVLWCAHEETPHERKALHKDLNPEDPFYIAYCDELPDLDAPAPRADRFGRMGIHDLDAPYIFLHAVQAGAKLIIIDCLHSACARLNLAENQAARFVMGRLRWWSMHFRIAVLVLHHLTKSATRGFHPERFADSAQILASASCHFFMERFIEDGPAPPIRDDVAGASRPTSRMGAAAQVGVKSRIILHGRGRNPAPAAKIELESNGILDFQLAKHKEAPKPKPTSAKTRILDLIINGWHLSAQEIAKNLEMNPTTVRMSLNDLQKEGQIRAVKSNERAARYELMMDEGV